MPPLVFVFSNLLCLVFIIVFFDRYRNLLELSQFLGNIDTFCYFLNNIFPSPIDKIVCFLPRLTLDLFNGIFQLLPDFIFVVLQFVIEVISWATSWILPFSLWVVLDKKSKKEVKAKKETEKKDHPTKEDSPAEAEKNAEMETITNEQEAVPVSQKDETPTTVSKPPRREEIRVADIKSYKELLDMGAITQEEYDAKKKQLLDL